MNKHAITRTIKSVIDVRDFSALSADYLLHCDDTAYNAIRRAATEGWSNDNPRYLCGKCGYAVYAPVDVRKRPYWKHFRGAPEDCPWWTGTPSSIDNISAKQFSGRQEGPLHFRLKHLVAELLNADSSAKEIEVEKYIVADGARRKPDVQAKYQGNRIAFEIQLATTQLPVIVAKEAFYRENGAYLIWLTWEFEERPFADVPQAFKDIYYSHSQNIFSLNTITVEESRKSRTLILMAHAYRDGIWQSRTTSLSALSWNENGLPYVFPPEDSWHQKFKVEWIKARHWDSYDFDKQNILLQSLTEKLQLELDTIELRADEVPALLDCLYSLADGRPVASRQRNLAELANTFLSSSRHYRFAKIFEYGARRCGQAKLLDVSSVRSKLEEARASEQVGRDSPPARIVRLLFPEWL